MVKDNELLENINIDLIVNESIFLKNNIIGDLSMNGCDFTEMVIIENCIIGSLYAIGTFFRGGIQIKNCVFLKEVSFEAGGHNDHSTVHIESNIFHEFLDFLDCHYTGPFIFNNNVLIKKSNLLGNLKTEVKVNFKTTPVISHNVGILNFDF